MFATQIWKRAIILIDMNAFFASVEQFDYPKWRRKPLAVTNGEMGTCIITCSYEAREYGVKTGMRLKEAKKICPNLIQAPSRPRRYAEISIRIMEALQQITPDIEIFSVDEAFLDITRCQTLYSSPIKAAILAKKIIYDVSGLPCSIGLSGNKITAKYAAKLKKPNGFTVIPPWEMESALANVRVTELCGIGENIAKFLAQYDVIYCKDMAKIPISILAKRFGNLGRRMWLMCQGKDPEPIHTTLAPPKTISHSKVLPPKTMSVEIIKVYFMHMAEKVAARLRYHNMYAANFFIGMCAEDWGWLTLKYRAICVTQNGRDIYAGCEKLLKIYPQVGFIRQVQITALNPSEYLRQLDLFEEENTWRKSLIDIAVDSINQKFGEFTIMPTMLLNKTKMPNVIAPAWRPKGSRRTV